jgi:hypothetical protein
MLEQSLCRAYAAALINAAEQTGLSDADFPGECPFTVDQVMSG